MSQQAIQLELIELQRRVGLLEARLGLGSHPAAALPRGGGALAEQFALRRELLMLRRRVQALEERAGITQEGTAVVSNDTVAAPAGAEPVPAEVREPLEATSIKALNVEVPPSGWAAGTLSQARTPMSTVTVTRPREAFTLERLVGGKVFGWIGSIAVVIGVAWLFKYGYDHRWFTVSPLVRCLMGAAFGLALIGVGELVRKRMNVVAAAGILAAGVGTVYASAFAAYRLYDLLAEVPGMVLLALAAGLGIAVGVRSRLISVTVLSLVGGYLAPFIIPGYSLPAVVPVFLLMLMTVGLVISARMGGKFRVLRSLVWWATLLIGGGWVLRVGVQHVELALVFIGLVWGGIHAELVYGVRRSVGTVEPNSAVGVALSWRSVVSSFSTTAWCTVLGVKILEASGSPPEWVAPAALMSITAMLWVALAGTLDTLREQPRNEAERLGAAMFAQASGLLLVTLALAFSARGEIVSWTILSLAALVGARWMRVRALDVYAMIVLAITSVRVLLIEAFVTRGSGASAVYGFVVSDWTAMTTLVGGAWVAGAFIMRREQGRWSRIANVLAGIGVATAAIGLLSPKAADFASPMIFVTAALAAAGLAAVGRSAGLAAFAWACEFLAVPLVLGTRWWHVHTPRGVALFGFHLEPVALCLVAIAATGVAVAWASVRAGLLSRVPMERRGVLGALGATALLVLAMSGVFHQDASLVSVCLAWLAIAVGVSAAGRLYPGRHLELVGLAGLMPSTVLWVPAFAMTWSPSSAPFMLHPGLGVAGLIGCAWWFASTQVRRAESHIDLMAVVRVITAIAIGAMVFVASSLEAARIASGVTADPTVRGAALSMWWGVLAIAMVGLGFWRRVQAVRWTGLGVLAIAMFKAVFFDLQDVPQLWRIVSFIGLGLMMLVVPVVYSRMSYVLKSRGEPAGTLGA